MVGRQQLVARVTSTVSTDSDHAADWPRLTGRQEPHHLSEWPGDEGDGEKAVELGRRVGKRSMPWQATMLRAWMRRRPDGLWTHRNCVTIISRQNGKTLLVILRILWGLFLANDRRGERIVYSAQRWPTSEDVYKRTWAIIKARPWLRRRVVQHICSGGRGLIVTDRGARCAFVTRSADLGKGFDEVDVVIYDEAYNLTDTERGALSPTQLASSNPQTIYLSTAVDEETMPNGEVLAAMRRRGLAREEDVYFGEWLAPEHMAVDDPATWRYANPSFGVIHTERDLREELRNAESPRARRLFGLEYLGRGRWPKPERGHVSLVDPEVWRDMGNPSPELTGPIALGLSRTRSREKWALSAAQWTRMGKVHLEVGRFRSATPNEMVSFILAVIERGDPVALVIDAHDPAEAIVPLLRASDIDAELTNASQFATACGGFLDDATTNMLSHGGGDTLADAVADATKRALPRGDFVWDDSIGESSTPLKAATLARYALITYGKRATRPASPSTGTASRPRTDFSTPSRGGELDLLTTAF